MTNFNDYIFVKSGKQTQKRYKVSCDNCGKDRGYLQLVLSGKRATSPLCVSCKNSTKQTPNTNHFCNFCNSEKMLPPSIGESDNHWFWDKNQNLKLGGNWRCRIMMKNKNIRWMSLNPEKYKSKQKRGSKTYRSTEQGRLRSNVSARMSYLLSKRGRKDLANISKLPWTVEELMIHLESLFEPGMTWENYGKDGWHVDHAVPDSWFQYSSIDDEGFIKSWSLSNLKPMWAKDNLSKSNRYAE